MTLMVFDILSSYVNDKRRFLAILFLGFLLILSFD